MLCYIISGYCSVLFPYLCNHYLAVYHDSRNKAELSAFHVYSIRVKYIFPLLLKHFRFHCARHLPLDCDFRFTSVHPVYFLFPAVRLGAWHSLASHSDIQGIVGHRRGSLLLQLDLLHPPHAAADLHEWHTGIQHTAGRYVTCDWHLFTCRKCWLKQIKFREY